MNTDALQTIARALLARGKGILAADESDGTMDKRLTAINAATTPEGRRTYRELLFTAPGIEPYLSGVILYDATIRNATRDGMPFPDLLTSRGIIPGIKVDRGLEPLPNFPEETVTDGLDGLADRLAEYRRLGARFTKWRAAFAIGEGLPSATCIEANVASLARYAALAQEHTMVPIVEPEVLYHGDHDLADAEAATTAVLQELFATLVRYRVDLSGVILKSSMVLAGDQCKRQSTPEEVADATIRTLRASVPKEVPGIVFLSGGQTPTQATENLQAIARCGAQPWALTFSYSRALEEPVLAAWRGQAENVPAAQAALLQRLTLNAAASLGTYDPEDEGG